MGCSEWEVASGVWLVTSGELGMGSGKYEEVNGN